MDDDDIGALSSRVHDEPQFLGPETGRLLGRRRKEDVDLARMPPQRSFELLWTEILTERRGVGERVDGFGVVARRRAQRLRDVAEHRIGVDQDRRAAACERRGEMRRDERDPDAAAAAVHRHHRSPPRRLAGPPNGGRGSPQQILAFLRPQEVAGRAGRIAVRSDITDSRVSRASTTPAPLRPPSIVGAATTASGSSWRIASASCRSSPAVATTRARPLRSRKCMTSSATSGVSSARTTLAT